MNTLVTYTYCACLFHINRTEAPGDSLLAKAISRPVSVAKANSVQGRSNTNRVQKEISILWLPTSFFGKSIFCWTVRLEK